MRFRPVQAGLDRTEDRYKKALGIRKRTFNEVEAASYSKSPIA